MQNEQEEALLALEQKRVSAMLANDVGELEDVLHPDLIYGHGTGVSENRFSYLNKIRHGETRYLSGESRIERVRMLGNIALIYSTVTMSALNGEQEIAIHNALLTVWTQDGASWRMIAHHPTRLPANS